MEQPRAGSARQVPVGIKVFRNIALLATLDDDYREIRNAAIIVKGNEIVYVGPDGEIPDELRTNADQTMDLSNHLALPGNLGVGSSSHSVSCPFTCCSTHLSNKAAVLLLLFAFVALAIAGLVSTHAHMFQALTRCLAQ
jgi:hypothetical protein